MAVKKQTTKKPKKEAEAPLEEFVPIWSGKVDIKRVDANIECQVRRNGIDDEVVKDYCRAIEGEGMEDLPAVDVFTELKYTDKAHLLLSDGFKRNRAYSLIGRQTIPVRVFRGGKSEAILHAIQKNSQHGERFTQKDRVHAVRMLLADPKYKDWSVRKLAEAANCSKSAVQNIKNPPAPKPRPEKKSDPETATAQPAAPAPVPQEAVPTVVNGAAGHAGDGAERFLAAAARPTPIADAPAVMPAVVRERQPSTLNTSEERLHTLRQWIEEGELDRGDVMNVFATPEGRMVWIPRHSSPSMKTLMIRHDGQVLIEAEVRVNADLAAVIDVTVADRRMVEYSAAIPVSEAAELMDPFPQQ